MNVKLTLRLTRRSQMLGTLPSHQGRGAGSLHLQWAAELADTDGVVSWLEGSPIALALYKRIGYERVREMITDLKDWGGEGMYCTRICAWEPSPHHVMMIKNNVVHLSSHSSYLSDQYKLSNLSDVLLACTVDWSVGGNNSGKDSAEVLRCAGMLSELERKLLYCLP